MATRTPTWYRPVDPAPLDLQVVRDRLSEATVTFNRGLAARQPFEWVLRDRDMNEWVAVRRQIYTESAGWIPEELEDVVLLADDGVLHIGARLNSSVYGGVISLALEGQVEGDQVRLRLSGTGLGSLPLPTRLIAGLIGPLLRGAPELKGGIAESRSQPRDVKVSELVTQGLLIRNEFTHPEGDWRFRIASIHIDDGEIRLGIQPL